MAQLDRLQKSFEELKVFTILNKLAKNVDNLQPIRCLKQENVLLNKNDYIQHCNIIADVNTARNCKEFHKLLPAAIQFFLILCDDDDPDIRLVASDCIDKICLLPDSSYRRVQVELFKEIDKNGSSRTLRVALKKFSELCKLIRPGKYGVFATKLFPSLVKIINRNDDELLQESLMQFFLNICPILGSYANDKEIGNIMNALIHNLDSTSSNVRRSGAISCVTICYHARKPGQLFNLLINRLLYFLAIERSSTFSEPNENLISGIFMVVRFMMPKIISVLNNETNGNSLPTESNEIIIENLIFIYQHLLTNIRYSKSNIVILSGLEALIEYINLLPYSMYKLIMKLEEGNDEFKSQSHLISRSPTCFSAIIRHDKRYESNLSITSSINYVENINDDFNDDVFKTSGILLLDSRSDLKSSGLPSECGDSEFDFNGDDLLSDIMYDQESDKFIEDKKAEDIDNMSQCSFDNCNNFSIETGDQITENFSNVDHFNLGSKYSLEYASKLICMKFLLSGEEGQLIDDQIVRVSIKSLAMSCLCSLISIHPELLFYRVSNVQLNSQPLIDLLRYSNHSDPNLTGYVAMFVGKFIEKVISLPIHYCDFVSIHSDAENELFQLKTLINILCSIAQKSSSIAIKQTLVSFQLFLPKLMQSNECKSVDILNIIEMLINLRVNQYWLVKVELINLFSILPYNVMTYLEQNVLANESNVSSDQLYYPLSKRILEDIFFVFAYDNDHRVRQAALNTLSNFIENLCLNSYLLNTDPINMYCFQTMLTNFCHQHNSNLFIGSWHEISSSMSPLDHESKCDSIFSINISDNLRHLNRSSNVLYFVKRFLFELCHNYERKSLFGSISALSTLAKLYPPVTNWESWNLSVLNDTFEMVPLFVEILTKNQTVMLDLSVHQYLINLIADLCEGMLCNQLKQLQMQPNIETSVQTENELYCYVSSNFYKYLQLYFMHLYKLIVSHAAICEESSAIFITFIYNIHSKNQSQLASFLKKRTGKVNFFKENDNIIKKELSNKASKKQESIAFDPIYHRLFDYLKNYIRNKKTTISHKSDKYSLLSTSLNCMSKLLEMIDHSFVLNYLEDLLCYLKMIFHLDPAMTILTVKQLLKCIFGVNHVGLFVDQLNDQINWKLTSSQSLENGIAPFRLNEINSIYNTSLGIPYIRLNEFFNNYRTRLDCLEEKSSFLAWFRKRVQWKVEKTLNTNGKYETTTENDNLKKLLNNKIQFFEPLVVKSLRFYTTTTDQNFQSEFAELLAQLIQLHINYCFLDKDNILIDFIMKQFESLENVTASSISSSLHEPLLKRLFYFMVILSSGHYVSNDYIDIPKVIQLCDALIANGHHKMALNGLYIILDDIFYFKNEQNVQSFSDLEAQREVILAYCFKLLHFHQTFDLLTLIVNYYKQSDRTKWTNFSIQIIELLTCKLVEGTIHLHSSQSLESLQLLLYSLCPTSFSGATNLLSHLFAKNRSESFLFEQWFSKMLLFLKLIILNLNETELIGKIQDIRSSIDMSVLSKIGDHDSATSNESVLPEKLLCLLLLNSLQMAIVELNEMLNNYKLKQGNVDFIVYLLSQYNLSLAFIFQSGFFPKITNIAPTLLETNEPIIVVNEVVFNFIQTNGLFLKLNMLIPNLTISWLNLLYILNYDQLPETLSKLICCSPCERNQSFHSVGINLQTVKRFSLILLCDYLTENLENVEYLSWLIINHIQEIIDFCYETPVKELINSINRKSSSSGLFLQAVNSRCVELLFNPMFAIKVLDCIERAHANQSTALIMFLLEKFLFNPQVSLHYKCVKYAESIVSARLMNIYELNLNRSTNTEDLVQKNAFNYRNITNLKKALKNTSYVKLKFTVQTIKAKFFDTKRHKKQKVLNDPLSEQPPEIVPEINITWFIDIIKQYWSVRQKCTKNAVHFFNKLTNNEIISLIESNQFLIENYKQVLTYIFEKIYEKQGPVNKFRSPNSDPCRRNLAIHILNTFHRFMQFLINKFPLANSFSQHCIIESQQIDRISGNQQFLYWTKTFLSPFQYLIKNLSMFERYANSSIISDSELDITILAIYSTCIYEAYNHEDIIQLVDILILIRDSLLNRTLFGKLNQPERIHLQLCIIDSIFFLMNNYFNLSTDFKLPEEMRNFGKNSPLFENIFDSIDKMLRMFHLLESSVLNKRNGHFPPIIFQTLRDIILSLSRLQFVNSLVYMPYSLFGSKSVSFMWKEVNFIGEFHTNMSIVNASHLTDLDLLKQFSFRISTLGFVNRIQFEEIWMTLLGVLSASLDLIAIACSKDDLNDNILLVRLVIRSMTNLLYQTKSKSLKRYANNIKLKNVNTDRFELIREIIHRKRNEISSNLSLYNKSYSNNCFGFLHKPISTEQLRDYANNRYNSPTHSHSGNEIDMENVIDLYSCLHFLVEQYLQTIESFAHQSLISFPILTEIAKSCSIISDLFTEKNQFLKLLQMVNELSKVVDNYEDEILNQYVVVIIGKVHLVLESTDETFERQKKLIIEQNFKDFFLPTRIGAVRSLMYMTASSNLLSNKDLFPVLDYVSKHLENENYIPSSYCTEYVDLLWTLSLCLIDRHSTLSASNDFKDKIYKALVRNLSRSRNIFNLEMICTTLEQLICTEKLASNDMAAISTVSLQMMKLFGNQLNSNYLLSLYVFSTFFGKSKDSNKGKKLSDNDELFMAMEQLSVIFEPLKFCNSFEANLICQVLGHFLVEFFPPQDLLNKCIGEFLSNQQSHYKYLTDILFVIFNKFQNDLQYNDTAQDWVILCLSSFTQLIPISHALWALTCFLVCASQNHWIRASYPYFQHRFGQFDERDKRSFLAICNNFFNEIKSDENKRTFIKTFQGVAGMANSPYFDVLKYLCDI